MRVEQRKIPQIINEVFSIQMFCFFFGWLLITHNGSFRFAFHWESISSADKMNRHADYSDRCHNVRRINIAAFPKRQTCTDGVTKEKSINLSMFSISFEENLTSATWNCTKVRILSWCPTNLACMLHNFTFWSPFDCAFHCIVIKTNEVIFVNPQESC